MKLPIFTTLVAFGAFCLFFSKITNRKVKKEEESFWERENRANSVRKQPLDSLNYISVPFEKLPLDSDYDNDTIRECINTINSLKDSKIVNLNGITNTDLKLQYGVANLQVLSEYDQNYTTYVKTLSIWGEELFKAEHIPEAVTVLETGISAGSDIKNNFILLADIYSSQKEYDKIEELIKRAEALSSITRNGILKELEKRSVFYPAYK